MKQKEITILTDDELNDKLGAFQKNLHDMKLTHAVSPLENPLQVRNIRSCLLYTSPSPRDMRRSRMPSSA